jgi:hypothetical protein
LQWVKKGLPRQLVKFPFGERRNGTLDLLCFVLPLYVSIEISILRAKT